MNKTPDKKEAVHRTIRCHRGNKGVPSIGGSFPRVEAFDKVTGKERFASDYYADGFAWAGVKRAGIPHGILTSIDVSTALAIPKIVKILTHSDVKGTNRQGVVRKDQPVLVDREILHCGDPIALVIAKDKESLSKALALIRFEYVPLPAVVDVEEALESDSSIVHEDYGNSNVLLDAKLNTGRGSLAEQECDCLVEEAFSLMGQEHAYLETECGWAYTDESDQITIICSTQAPFRDRAEIAEALGIDSGRIRIVAPYAGGAFGGKDGVTVQSLLALAVLHSGGLPVKMQWGREESFVAGAKRHPARIYMKLGAKLDGTLHYLDVRIYLDTGPYDHLGGVVLTQALEHLGGPYRIPHTALRGWCVYTNNPIGGAFRGFGATQATAAIEQMIDILARQLKIDPIKIRFKNVVGRGDRNAVGKTVATSVGIKDCLSTIEGHEIWENRFLWKEMAGHFKRRGVGVVALAQAIGYGPVVPDYANAKVELTDQGQFRVYCGVVDMGQGNTTANVQIAASLLSQSPDTMEYVLPDTEYTLPSCSASASRCTYAFGNALVSACTTLRERILRRSADMLMVETPLDLQLIPGCVRHTKSDRDLPLAVIAQMLAPSERIAVGHFRAAVAKEEVTKDARLRLHGLPHNLFSYAAHLAAVEVDELTGKVDVMHYVSVSDCGTVLNPQVYEQQIHGGIAQGIGYALHEQVMVSEGRIMNGNFSDYILPSAKDVPDIQSIALNLYEETGPFGLKGIGEISMNGPLPAISNAVTDAIGVRLTGYPMNPERVFSALRVQQERPALG